ncbi:MAG: G5 domain-containing protein [Neobacillus sp.]
MGSKYQQLIKLFTVLFLSTAVIFSSSHFGSEAFGKFSNNDGLYNEGTIVGSVNLSGKTENEAIALLEEKYVEWVNSTKFELRYSEKTVNLDINLFQFDATETVLNLKEGKTNNASLTIDLLQVEEQINILFPQVDSKEIELTKLTADLTNAASQLQSGTFSFALNKDYQLVESKKAVISEVVVELEAVSDELYNLIKNNPEIQIAEEATFSFLEFAKAQKIENNSALDLMATGIYQAVLPTNLSIKERNISEKLPSYAVLGFEAMVNSAKGVDLVIVNPNKATYTLGFDLSPGSLKVTLTGDPLLYKYEISKKNQQELKPKTIIQYSPLLLPGKTKVENEGADGKIVKVYRNIYEGSQLLTSELISEDYYPPVFRVEIHGLTGITQTGTGTNTTGQTTPSESQSPSPSNTDQQDNQDDDLWGKSNEQPK